MGTRETLIKYLSDTMGRLNQERPSAEILKGKVMPKVVEGILNLSGKAPADLRQKLKAALQDKSVLPNYEADCEALCSALSTCIQLLGGGSDGIDSATAPVVIAEDAPEVDAPVVDDQSPVEEPLDEVGEGAIGSDVVDHRTDVHDHPLLSYLKKMFERLTAESFSPTDEELKEKIMPSVADGIRRLSGGDGGYPDEVRQKLKAALIDAGVLPNFNSDLGTFRSAISLCVRLVAAAATTSQATNERVPDIVDDGSSARGESSTGRSKGNANLGDKGTDEAKGIETFKNMHVRFCPDPKTTSSKFTATYEAAPEHYFGSVNAGDEKLYVGGSTINKQFANDLWYTAWQYTDKYEPLHKELMKSGKACQLVTAPQHALDADPRIPVRAAYVRMLKAGQPTGAVFIDVFKQDLCPHKHAKNTMMVYTVGPRRQDCGSDAEFKSQVTAMARNLSAACMEYNDLGVEPPLEVLRVCLVSGGAFAGGVPKLDVAKAICQGLAEGHVEGSSLVFEFSFDEDAFRCAWEELLSS
eukprot:TRINITY_DN2951_c0_g1_i1.p1 TRINITY_DN2951_c0_g1~~TRINITY_DN2951_c0_g1_i1.p1  ORF type:complete len:526 (+),score=88.94 TRINITY_DN2951_c0_g1_i1:56-1633(+)